MSLAHLVREKKWSELESAWTEHILGDAALAPALEAVQAAAQRKELPRCLNFVRDHADVLVQSGRAPDAAELLGQSMVLGGSPGELAQPLFAAAQAAWGEEDFWEAYTEIANFRENVPEMRPAWRSLRKLLNLEPKRIVYHAKGWGLGEILAIDAAKREVTVRFVTGRRDRFPFTSAVDIFEILPEDDVRVLVVKDPDELKRKLSKEPLEILRWILSRNDGKVNHAGIKLAMGTLGVEGPKFSAWWRKAKKQAETSEWFEVSGPSTKVVVRALAEAADPADSMRRQLKRSKSLTQALQRVRELVSGTSADESVVEAAVQTLEELAADADHPMEDRIAAFLFLRDRRGETPETLRAMFALANAAPEPGDPSVAPALWQLFQSVPGLREQERCIDILREIRKDDWLEVAARNLPHAAPGMVRGLVDLLEQNGRHADLVSHYGALLARPTRNPTLLVRLAERIEDGSREGELPAPQQRAQCLLQVAIHLFKNSPGNPGLTRARTRLAEVLTRGEPPLLRRLLEDANLDTLRGLASMIESGVDREIDRVFTKLAVDLSPDVFRGDERPFWESSGTWTTAEGLRKREEELRVLREIKIPENAEAIGRAASYGDLSENSEWEAAIEDQRNLTNRAMELEAEVRDAQLIENAALPDDTVCPGTAVRYRDLSAGTEHRIEIVGPWDTEREDQVSYRSPLAAGMLGKRAGEQATLTPPSGTIEVEVLEVVPLPL